MIKDLHFDFIGFHGSDGYCHLRVAQHSSASKMVIVCSQYKNYFGTSPTNSVELIAEKFFYDIVNEEIEGITLPTIVTYEKWQEDANGFDKILVKLFPEKYKTRFKNTFLDIPKIFKEIIWIERYPAGTGFRDNEDDFSLVSMGDKKDPRWHGRPSPEFIFSETGFTIPQLFAEAESIDLIKVQDNIKKINEGKNFIHNHVNRPVRWTQILLEQLPSKIKNARFSTGRDETEEVWELHIQTLIEEIFNICFPARDLFEREFKISKLLRIHKTGGEKKCDLVLFEPESNKPSVMIELKRASKSVKNRLEKIHQDIAKLLIYSSEFQCDSYFIICGDKEELTKTIKSIENIMSFENDYANPSALDKYSSISTLELTQEFAEMIRNFHVRSIYTRLIGISEDNTVAIWQISHTHENLVNNRPYLYRLVNALKSKH